MNKTAQCIQFLRGHFPAYSLPISVDDARDMVAALDNAGLINFSAVLRSCGDGCESWTQLEYWSERLSKCVVWDFAYEPEFDSLDAFALDVVATDDAIAEFDVLLPDIAQKTKGAAHDAALVTT